MERCECADPGCLGHVKVSKCTYGAWSTVYRIDMADETGTRMCETCAGDALESGVFTTSRRT